MELGQVLTMCLMATMALGGVAIGVTALVALQKTVKHQSSKLAELATKRPYWIIERTERGSIENIVKLENRVSELERPARDPDATNMLEEQWANRNDEPLPQFTDDDVPDIIGSRE